MKKLTRLDLISEIEALSGGLLQIPLHNAINEKYYSVNDLIKIREMVKKYREVM